MNETENKKVSCSKWIFLGVQTLDDPKKRKAAVRASSWEKSFSFSR
jgi:hypothetical protein